MLQAIPVFDLAIHSPPKIKMTAEEAELTEKQQAVVASVDPLMRYISAVADNHHSKEDDVKVLDVFLENS